MVKISGGLLARNTFINLIGQGLPLLVAVVAIPIIVRGMGMDRFGLLSLVWVFMGSFAIFDLGLGRATTKFVAEALCSGNHEEVPLIVWTAVTVQAILGVVGGVVLLGITTYLVVNVLNIPIYLITEAKNIFYLIAVFVPVVLITGSFSGVLEAAQRFDYVNIVRISSSTLSYILPIVGLLLGFGLPGIVALIMSAKFVCLVALIALNFRILPGLKKYSVSLSHFPRLFSFGGWVMISNILGPIIYYLDRFIIGSFLTMAAVTYYTVPFEMTSRIAIISGSLAMTLFPAFSALGSTRREELQRLYVRSIKYILLITGPIILILLVFADSILRIWIGEDFAHQSTLVFQLLLVGYLVALIHPVSGGLIQGLGRPDIIPKLYLAYFPFNIALVWLFVHTMGIIGAALFFVLRAMIETVIYFVISSRLIHLPYASLKDYGLWRSLSAFLTLGMFLWGISIIDMFAIKVGFTAVASLLFIMVTWHYVLDEMDKTAIMAAMGKWPSAFGIICRRLYVEK